MSQLIAIGNVLINLEQITVLDIDPVPNRADIMAVRIYGTSSRLTEVLISSSEQARLLTLAATRFSGNDDPIS